MINKAKISKSDNWVRCWNCNHKLFLLNDNQNKDNKPDALEIKCHSCKALNRW